MRDSEKKELRRLENGARDEIFMGKKKLGGRATGNRARKISEFALNFPGKNSKPTASSDKENRGPLGAGTDERLNLTQKFYRNKNNASVSKIETQQDPRPTPLAGRGEISIRNNANAVMPPNGEIDFQINRLQQEKKVLESEIHEIDLRKQQNSLKANQILNQPRHLKKKFSKQFFSTFNSKQKGLDVASVVTDPEIWEKLLESENLTKNDASYQQLSKMSYRSSTGSLDFLLDDNFRSFSCLSPRLINQQNYLYPIKGESTLGLRPSKDTVIRRRNF
jgi:hypothetical protein